MEINLAILAFTVGGFVLSCIGTGHLFYSILKNPVPRNFSDTDIQLLAVSVTQAINTDEKKDISIIGEGKDHTE